MNMKNIKNFRRHGDINFFPISKKDYSELVKNAKEEKHDGSFVVQLGETTGHRHIATIPDITKMKVHRLPDGGLLMSLDEDAVLTHEDHKKLVMPVGFYREVREREIDWFAEGLERKIID